MSAYAIDTQDAAGYRNYTDRPPRIVQRHGALAGSEAATKARLLAQRCDRSQLEEFIRALARFSRRKV